MLDETSEGPDKGDPQTELEKKKVELEIEKLHVEMYKARWSAISAIVPIVVTLVTVASTVIYGAWSLNQTARVQFGTKIIEVAMHDSRNEEDSMARAKLMGRMFTEYVPKDFVRRLEEINLRRDLGLTPRDWQYEPKNMLLHLFAQYPEQRRFVLDAYEKLYPLDSWPRDLYGLLPAKPDAERKSLLGVTGPIH
jgi:hypothetical protein